MGIIISAYDGELWDDTKPRYYGVSEDFVVDLAKHKQLLRTEAVLADEAMMVDGYQAYAGEGSGDVLVDLPFMGEELPKKKKKVKVDPEPEAKKPEPEAKKPA